MDIPHEAAARGEVVAVFLGRAAEVLEPDGSVEPAGLPRRLQLPEQRVRGLVDGEAGREIVAAADIDREPVRDAPGILCVGGVLVDRQGHAAAQPGESIEDPERRLAPVGGVLVDHRVEHDLLGGGGGRVGVAQAELELVRAGLDRQVLAEEVLLLGRRLIAGVAPPDPDARREGLERSAGAILGLAPVIGELQHHVVEQAGLDQRREREVQRVVAVTQIDPGLGRQRRRVGRGAEAVQEVVAVVRIAQRKTRLGRRLRGQLREKDVLVERDVEDTVLLGHDAERVHGAAGRLVHALVGREEVDPVALQRTAQAAAVLVAAEIALGRAGQALALGQGLQRVVAQMAERRALQGVGAALGDHVQHAAARAAVLDRIAIVEVELVDRLEREELRGAAAVVVVVLAAVDHGADVAAGAAGDLRRVLRGAADVQQMRQTRAGRERRHVRVLPAVQRQLVDLDLRHDLARPGVLEVDQRRGGGDRDGFGLYGKVEAEVHDGRGRDVDRDRLGRGLAQALHIRAHAVGADRQPRHAERALAVAHRFAVHPGVGAVHGDRDTRDRGAGVAHDPALDGAVRALGESQGRSDDRGQKTQREAHRCEVSHNTPTAAMADSGGSPPIGLRYSRGEPPTR